MINIFESSELIEEEIVDCTCSCNCGKPTPYGVGYMDGYQFTKLQNRKPVR